MKRILTIALFVFPFCVVFGQSKAELTNRAVLNKIEFFINTQMTDSIYNLAAESFKQEVSADKFGFIINNLYQLGKIKNVELLDFKQETGTYLLEFPSSFIQLQLTVNPAYNFEGILFAPGKKPVASPVVEKVVLSEVERLSPTDFVVDSLAKIYSKNPLTNSLAIGVFHNNKYQSYFYGSTHKGGSSLASDATIYEIGSISKVFTSILLADLVNKNILKLEDPISKFLPDSLASNPDLQKITFKQLANHSSGLPRLPENWDKVAGFNPKDPYANYDRKALYAYLKGYKAKRPAGESYEYSNLGAGLLGELIATISKKPYATYLKEIIFTPLQMTSSTDKPTAQNPLFIPVYNDQGVETAAWNFQAMLAAGGIKSSLHDMMLFAVEQLKMPQTSLQHAMALTREYSISTPSNSDVGLGWHMNMVDQGIYFWHNGGTGGSRSFIGVAPDTKTAIVVLSNTAISVDELSVGILEKLMESKN